jgi:hypothetical protein
MLFVAGTTCAAGDNFRGIFSWGHEVQSFQPCGSKLVYWVVGEENVLRPLRHRTENLRAKRGEPYQPIYVETTGVIDIKSKREGFAESYDGLFQVRKVASVSDVLPNGCAK